MHTMHSAIHSDAVCALSVPVFILVYCVATDNFDTVIDLNILIKCICHANPATTPNQPSRVYHRPMRAQSMHTGNVSSHSLYEAVIFR